MLTSPRGTRSPTLAAAGFAGLSLIDSLLAASENPRVRRARRLTKPLLMPALATSLLSSTAPNRLFQSGARLFQSGDGLRSGVLVAEALSGLGDVALLSHTDRGFLTGLGSFFAAHVAYVAAFTSASGDASAPASGRGPAVAAGVFVVGAPIMSRAAGKRSPRLRLPVLAYAGVLSAMYAASTRLGEDVPPEARRTVVAGTALFLVSDSILATRKFLVRQPPPAWSDGLVMATYTAGQGLIALGVARTIAADQNAGQAAGQGAGTTSV